MNEKYPSFELRTLDDVVGFWERQRKEALRFSKKGKEIEAMKQEIIGCRMIIEWLLQTLEIKEIKWSLTKEKKKRV